MGLLEIIWIAFGLSMDSFAVSLSSGAQLNKKGMAKGVKIALFFAVFQGGMTLVGWGGGVQLRHFAAHYAHWIAMATLLFLGGKMLIDALRNRREEVVTTLFDPSATAVLIGLSIATSIDAMAVGVSMALLQVEVLRPALIIALTTLVCSLVAFYLGKRWGNQMQHGAELMGGVVLILLGIKIIATHYMSL